MGRLELEVPVSSGIKSMGLRPTAFVDIGSLWKVTTPELIDVQKFCSSSTTGMPQKTIPGGATDTSCLQFNTGGGSGYSDDPTQTAPGFKEVLLGNSPKPRLSIGVGVNWTSPFGPLRIDLAKALLKQKGDDTKLFSFNVGTQF